MSCHRQAVECGALAAQDAPPDKCQGRRQRQEVEGRLPGLRRHAAVCAPGEADLVLDLTDCPLGADLVAEALPAGAPPPPAGLAGRAAGADLVSDGSGVEAEPFIGGADRMHHLALIAGRGPAPEPGRQYRADALVLPPGPTSRAECRRRCGTGGFCDPSEALGCGGEYCGNANAAAREAL